MVLDIAGHAGQVENDIHVGKIGSDDRGHSRSRNPLVKTGSRDEVSAESGVSRPSQHIYRRSPVGATYDAFDSERYVLTFENKAFREIAAIEEPRPLRQCFFCYENALE